MEQLTLQNLKTNTQRVISELNTIISFCKQNNIDLCIREDLTYVVGTTIYNSDKPYVLKRLDLIQTTKL